MNGSQNGKGKKMRNERNFSIIVLAQRMVKKRVRRGSFYTPRGKRKALGSLPSVKSKAKEQIPRRGAPKLGFELWNDERMRWKGWIGGLSIQEGRTRHLRRTHVPNIAIGVSLGKF